MSGGQTGVDRAALDVALARGIPCGGWCPAGRRAEDGCIPEQYPLRETESANYAVRTRFNVRDSDGTLILSETPLSGGTALTMNFVRGQKKPGLVIDVSEQENAPQRFAEWVQANRIRILNVAGPRAGSDPTIYERSVGLLHEMLDAVPPEHLTS